LITKNLKPDISLAIKTGHFNLLKTEKAGDVGDAGQEKETQELKIRN
jgi:hypothetical protein